MNRRERVIAALNFEKPDCVPYSVAFTQPMLKKMVDHTGLPDYRETIGNHIITADLLMPQTEVRPGFFRDEYGVVWNKSGVDKDIGVVDCYLLEDTDELEDFPIPEVDEAFVRTRVEEMLNAAGDRFRVASLGFSLFERAWTLRGMENLLCDMIVEPEFVHALMDKIVERNLKILDIVLEYDVDAVYFGDDWGQQKGLIMGPVHWRNFIKPRLRKMYDRVHAAGKYVIQHSCGDVREIMEDLYEVGLNMYQTFQPEIYTYDYAKVIYGKIAIWGGISTQRDLPTKTPEEIKAVTREILAAFPHGGLVAAPTHDVPFDVPPQNILAMLSVLQNQ